MFLYLSKGQAYTIRVTASEGRGALPEARITFRHLTTGAEIVLDIENTSQNLERFDEFQIQESALDDLPPGDLLYSIKATPGGDIDPDITLETGRARIRESFTESVQIFDRQTEDIVYERS